MNILPLRDMIQVDETWRPTRHINHFSIRFTHSYLNYLSHICMRSTPNSPWNSAAMPDSFCSIYHQKPRTKLSNTSLQTAIRVKFVWGYALNELWWWALCWCFTFKADLGTAIFHWCLPQIKAMSPYPPLPPPHRAKDTRIMALLAYLPRWCMAPIASQSPTVFITNYGGRSQLITTETAEALVCPHAHRFDVRVLLI